MKCDRVKLIQKPKSFKKELQKNYYGLDSKRTDRRNVRKLER
jgi:hypothetical protein